MKKNTSGRKFESEKKNRVECGNWNGKSVERIIKMPEGLFEKIVLRYRPSAKCQTQMASAIFQKSLNFIGH